MNSLKNNLLIIAIGILAVMMGALVGNSKVALLVSLLIAVFSFMKKEVGLLFLIIFIPLRPFLITVNPGFKILGDAIIGLLLIRTFFDYRKDIKKLFAFHPFEWAFIAFAIIGVISAFLTGVSLASIITQLRAYFLFYIVYYVIKRMNITTDLIVKMTWTTFLMGVFLSLHGLVEKIFHKTLFMPHEWQEWWLSPTNRIRVYGLLKGPNELSLFLLIAFIASLYLLKHIHGKMRYFIYTGLVLIGTTILLTYSRGTLLTLIAFLVVYIVISRKWRSLISIGLVAILSYGVFFAVNQAADQTFNQYSQYAEGAVTADDEDGESEGKKRFKETFSDETMEQSTSGGRIYRVKKALEIFKDHPVIGTGFGTFGGAATLAYSSPIYEQYDINEDFYSDNQYAQILAETGALGMLAIMMIGYFLLVVTWKKRKEFYGPLLVYFFVALIVGGTVYNILENDTFMLMYFLLLGIVLQKRQTNEK